MSPGSAWRIAVDTGGTFTDCLGIDPQGRQHRAKVLSSGALRLVVDEQPSDRTVVVAGEPFVDGFFEGWTLAAGMESLGIVRSRGNRLELAGPAGALTGREVSLQSPEEAAVVAIRWVTGTAPGRRLPPVALRLATTRGTNALLERKGARVALFVTRGFGDLLEIGNQQRVDLFALSIRKPDPLYGSVVEVDERLDPSGQAVSALDEVSLAREARRLSEAGFDSAAIAFLHSFRNPRHEERAARVLAAAGFRQVSTSSSLSRRIKIVPRAQTALVDAYLAQIMRDYLGGVARSLEPSSLHVMTSVGGLVGAAEYRPKDSLLSGPAAGVVGAVAAGRRSGYEQIIAFDMGGTSTDVSRYDGELELRAETAVGQTRLLSASVAVETVAAGGGSICRWRGGGIRVGPESAGAWPGPACYGAGGPLTLTDVNLLLGRLVPSRFPFRVDSAAARKRALEVGAAAGRPASQVTDTPGASQAPPDVDIDTDDFLSGFLAIANERMAGAVRAISVRRGYDPSEYTLVAFGGAGAQHAVAIAELLGIQRVLIPADGALLSAAGLNEARLERWSERQVLEPLTAAAPSLEGLFEAMRTEASAALQAEGVSESALENGPRTVFLRYGGQESTLAVDWQKGLPTEELVAEFERAYVSRYGYLPENRTPEVESLRLAMRSIAESGPSGPPRRRREELPASVAQRFWDGSTWVEAPARARAGLTPGDLVPGPCLIVERHTVTVVEKGWSGSLDPAGGLVLERGG
ncbi:MAG: hydantoinase/oxoprolinase family protein [bacterium]|nr:hydantoinase/oxoprolinase family protein [bacterium]